MTATTNAEIDAVLAEWDDADSASDAMRAAHKMAEMLRALRDQREADALPAGWVLCTADASFQSSDPRRQLSVLLIRDPAGKAKWHELSEEEMEATPLYWTGVGMTINEAIRNARAAMSAHGGEMNSEQERELAGRMRKAGVFDAMERNGYPYKQMLEETQRQAAILVDRIAALEAELARYEGALRMVGVLKQLGGMMPGSKKIVDSVVEECAAALKPAKEG